MKFQKIISFVACGLIALTNVGTGFSTCSAVGPAPTRALTAAERESLRLFSEAVDQFLPDKSKKDLCLRFAPGGCFYGKLTGLNVSFFRFTLEIFRRELVNLDNTSLRADASNLLDILCDPTTDEQSFETVFACFVGFASPYCPILANAFQPNA